MERDRRYLYSEEHLLAKKKKKKKKKTKKLLELKITGFYGSSDKTPWILEPLLEQKCLRTLITFNNSF